MLLYFSLITIIFSIVLAIYNWRSNKTAIYLSLTFILISVYGISHYFVVYAKDPFWIAVTYNHVTPLTLLIGPFLYFYIRGTLTDKAALTLKDLVHFIPMFVHLMGMYQWYFIPFQQKLQIAHNIIDNIDSLRNLRPNTLFSVETAFFLRPASLMIYGILSTILIWKHFNRVKESNKITQQQFIITYRWLIVLVFIILMLCTNWIILTSNFITTGFFDTIHKSNYLYGFTGAIFGIMALILLFFPQVLYGIIPNYQVNFQDRAPIKISNELDTDKLTPIKSKTVAEPHEELIERIKFYLKDQKPFTDPEFSMEDMALALEAPLNHIAYCINNVMHTKFTELRMQYRIEYAKNLLKEGMRDSHTIENIAQQAGFSTRSNFYTAFKIITGLTPTEYIKKQHKK